MVVKRDTCQNTCTNGRTTRPNDKKVQINLLVYTKKNAFWGSGETPLSSAKQQSTIKYKCRSD